MFDIFSLNKLWGNVFNDLNENCLQGNLENVPFETDYSDITVCCGTLQMVYSYNNCINELKDYYKPQWSLDRGGKELVELFDRINLNEGLFRGRETNRIKQLTFLKETNLIDDYFRMRAQ